MLSLMTATPRPQTCEHNLGIWKLHLGIWQLAFTTSWSVPRSPAHNLQSFLSIFSKRCPLEKLNSFNNHVIHCKMRSNSDYDGNSNPNYGCKKRITCMWFYNLNKPSYGLLTCLSIYQNISMLYISTFTKKLNNLDDSFNDHRKKRSENWVWFT